MEGRCEMQKDEFDGSRRMSSMEFKIEKGCSTDGSSKN